jgi:hypothetical protein
MKDADARKEIKDLKEQIFILESKVSGLEHKIDRQTHLFTDTAWDYFGAGNKCTYLYPTREVLRLLLSHLGLELDTEIYEEKIVLKKKE